mgnify:FL=1
MKKLFILFVFLLIYGCSKPKTVLICGDHVCINKAEAEQYFEENLTLEVRVVDSKKSKEINLVELNLESNSKGKKEISILSKKQTSKKVKKLSKTEIRKKKAQLKKRKNGQTKKKQNAKTKKNKKKKIIKQVELKKSRSEAKTSKNILKRKRIVNKPKDEIIDICTIIKKCSIEEISKYLVKEGKNKKFPDITTREN